MLFVFSRAFQQKIALQGAGFCQKVQKVTRMVTFFISSHPVVLFLTIFPCFLVFSRLFRVPFPAPCSAFSHGSAKRDLFRTSVEIALQGARILLRKTAVFRVFSCFPVFSSHLSGLPTHHFEGKCSKVTLLSTFAPFGQLLPEPTSGQA